MKNILAAAALFGLAACASTHPIQPTVVESTQALASAQTVEVRLSNFDFEPSTIRLDAGKPYRLKLVSSGGHSFAAPEFFAAARLSPEDAALVASGEVQLDEGETKTVTLIPAAGKYSLVCTHTGHALLGMKGEIIVE